MLFIVMIACFFVVESVLQLHVELRRVLSFLVLGVVGGRDCWRARFGER